MRHHERIIPGEDWSRGGMADHVQRYRFASNFVAGKRVLDAGCGIGYGARLLAEAGAAEIVAVDISEEALTIANQRFHHPAVRYVQDDLHHLRAITGPFDTVIALESFEHLQHPELFLSRAAALIASEGTFICSTPRRAEKRVGPPENTYHVREYTTKEFEAILHMKFEHIRMLGQHWSAATRIALSLWMNPVVRLGRWMQRVRGRHIEDPIYSQQFATTEADLVISEVNCDLAWALVAICTGPKP
ncbi:MAG: class I SAM-dependent methyltransferase [Candidatus Korobacteraceae bacterium]